MTTDKPEAKDTDAPQTEALPRRMSVIGIVVSDRGFAGSRVNTVLSQFGNIIVARTGVPWREGGGGVISLIVDANTNELGALTGKLGMIRHVRVRSVML
ncbi:MAG: TM1266 family iron-only hydrogenase system putative regulator [Desulfovibrionaceae bacterium]